MISAHDWRIAGTSCDIARRRAHDILVQLNNQSPTCPLSPVEREKLRAEYFILHRLFSMAMSMAHFSIPTAQASFVLEWLISEGYKAKIYNVIGDNSLFEVS